MSEFEERYRAARRRVIENDLRRLNPMQRQAAMTTQGPLLLLAGAGSGKTTVLIQRIYTLLTYGVGSDSDVVPEWASQDDLEFLEQFPDEPTEEQFRRAKRLCAVAPPKPWEIIAITFTNKAAGEIKERLAARLGSVAHDVWASTFHSACVRILRRNIDRIGFDRDFTIYDTDDSIRTLKEVIKDLNLDAKAFSARSVLSEIGRAKDAFLNPEEYAQEYLYDRDWSKNQIGKIYAAYQKRLRASNALDFDDLLFYAVALLKREPDVLQYYQDKFHYVLVDEYQDTNRIQDTLTSLLAGGHRNLCVVGDDDQSIYSFRGANIENILGFEERYPDCNVIRLEENYRSTQNILDAANAVIARNVGRKGKTLWTSNPRGAKVEIRTEYNEQEEAAFIADDILSGVQNGRTFRDSAVLYRVNALSNAIEYALKRNGVPYRVVGGVKFFERAEIKDMLSYLCVANNPLDDLRFRRVVNNPPRGIGQATLAKTAALAESQGLSIYEIFRNADMFPELKGVKAKLLKFADFIDDLRKKKDEIPLTEFYDYLCEQSGYVAALESKKDEESKGRLENVRELKSNVAGFLDRNPDDPTLSGFLNEIALYTDLDSAEFGDNCVTLMSVHAAKGLEFPVVYVAGLEEGVFPNANALYALHKDKSMEEERRLCYVAMTRAKERLVLTNARQRLLYGYTSTNAAARFLEDIPESVMDWTGKPKSRASAYGAWGYGGRAASNADAKSSGATSNAGAKSSGATSNAGAKSNKAASGGAGSITENGMKINPHTGEILDKPPAKSGELKLYPGDVVYHDAFGRGVVQSVAVLSRDALLVVRFDAQGEKKLMLNSAKARMRKLDE